MKYTALMRVLDQRVLFCRVVCDSLTKVIIFFYAHVSHGTFVTFLFVKHATCLRGMRVTITLYNNNGLIIAI